ncbi:DUF3306 domain-containing protein [Marinobacter salinisoli]|uniref:DUF3306 domain-containing protein n=1 Tax=Marinobacter salinisoli TaxID=2769486 RepID=A0ABX7MTU8_9GAMM|nr:DUF3306 domain-containing protein [Marinobacter salinisoli]QSP95815.1 DUF3306 domain-containing protein [Marinobacter salinisoli]
MAESRFQRWSRKKSAARQETELPPLSPGDSQPSHEEQELAINETLPERELLAKYDLPDPDNIELGMDITGFMRKEIPEFLRRRALRSLWKSNPVLAVLDGLNDYDEDFTDAAAVTSGFKTLYKVGQGYFDKNARADKGNVEPAEAPADQSTELPAPVTPSSSVRVTEALSAPSEVDTDAVSLITPEIPQADEATETEQDPTPRYRPRMRFE